MASVLNAYSNGVCRFHIPIYSPDTTITQPIDYSVQEVRCLVNKFSYKDLDDNTTSTGDYSQVIRVMGRFTSTPLPPNIQNAQTCEVFLENGLRGKLSYTTKLSSPYYSEHTLLGIAFSGVIYLD